MIPTALVVGRDAELAAIAAFVDEAGRAPAGLVLEGDAGIGKSTLWFAGVELSASRGYRVLRCRPVAAETQLAFAGLGDLLAKVFEDAHIELPGAQQESGPRTAGWSRRSTGCARRRAGLAPGTVTRSPSS